MKYFLILIISFYSLFGEDFSLSVKKQNDNFLFPKIDKNLTFNEFELLSTSVNLKDIGYSLIVPGYMHYKAKDNFNGNIIMTIRTLSYMAMSYLYFDTILNSEEGDRGSFVANYLNMSKEYQVAFGWAMNISIAAWLFDWIHGVNVLHNKQNLIRYKYSFKASVGKAKDGSIKTTVGYKAEF